MEEQIKIVKGNITGEDSTYIRRGTGNIEFDSNTHKILLDGVNYSGDTLIETTYSELRDLRNNKQLIPGCWYRITDYTCTTVQANTQSAGHVFDILVLATSSSALSENARAVAHEGDTYFANSNLNTWELKYSLENNTEKFKWADSTNGKGVIYYMKDEWNNECPYDFRNIQFKRKLTNGDLDTNDGTETWVYTFSHWNSSESIIDDGILYNNVSRISGLKAELFADNIIKVRNDGSGPALIQPKRVLNGIVLLNNNNSYSVCNKFEKGCYDTTVINGKCNIFEARCYAIIVKGDSNVFESECYGIKFLENYSSYNTFGQKCTNITFEKQINFCNVEAGNTFITITSSQTGLLRNITIAQGVNNTTTVKTISHDTINDTFQTIYRPANSQIVSV